MCPDTSRRRDTICVFPGCQRTVWKDPDGSFSAFCGNGHRKAMALQTAAEVQLCKNCHIKPVYKGNGQLYEFCGVRCGRSFQKQGGLAAQPPLGPTNPLQLTRSCTFVGCYESVWIDDCGTATEYCSNSHRISAVDQGAEACLCCKVFPKTIWMNKRSDFCSETCKQNAVDSAPAIFELDVKDEKFLDISTRFLEAWKHPGDKPDVVKIWKVYNDKLTNNQFDQYQLTVERRTSLTNGNTRGRWHGTMRACTIGNTAISTTFCDNVNCSLCCILKSSFQMAKAGTRYAFGRFGRGIYTSATSSKAFTYVQQTVNSPYQAMLLSNVILGKTAKFTNNTTMLTRPPKGYDSVTGEPGGILNYDESIVYRDDAIRPTYLVIFKLSGNTNGNPIITKPQSRKAKPTKPQSIRKIMKQSPQSI